MTTIADYRTKVRAILGTSVDASSWPESLLDAGVRQALPVLAEHLPIGEATVVCAAGREQDLSGVPDLYAIGSLGWPWRAEEAIFRHVRWRPVGDQVVHIESGVPAAGDGLRLRYWRRLTVSGLDGAAATTVPDRCADLLASGAAGYALLVRLRQLGENPAAPKAADANYVHLAGALIADFSAGCGRLDPIQAPPAWTAIGL